MKLTYVGPYDHVTVPLPLGGRVACERGGQVDVPDSYADQLLAQPTNWQAAKAASRTTIPDLRAQLEAEGVEAPANAKKADLEQLLEQATKERHEAERQAAEQVAETSAVGSTDDQPAAAAADQKESS